MKPVPCVHEDDIARAARTGEWTKALRAHAAQCAVCSEVALLAGWFAAETQAASREAVLPGSSHIWWKAELRARQEMAERALRPIAVLEKVAYVFGGAILIGALLWSWPLLSACLRQIIGAWTHAAPVQPAPPANVMLLACTTAVTVVLLVALGAYSMWSEDSGGNWP